MNTRARVLVIDAQSSLSHTLHAALAHHEVEIAHDAVDAIYRIDRTGRPYDIIFCDLACDLPGPELWAYLALTHRNAAKRMVFVASGPLRPETQAFLMEVPNACVELPIDADAMHMFAVRRASPEAGRESEAA